MRGIDTHRRPTPGGRTAGKLEFIVRNTRLEDGDGVREAIVLANGSRLDAAWPCIDSAAVAEQLRRFPEGQFVAVIRDGEQERVIGAATTMRTNRSPDEPPLRWMEMIGSHGIANHQPEGDWLYGVEIAVHPEFQRRGVATALYRVRLALVEKLGLQGWYAGGMLMGYHRYRDRMGPREYARRVVRGELEDPTVSMQMRRGLKPKGFIEEYCNSPLSGNAAVLLVWRPPNEVKQRKVIGAPGAAAGARR
jgi:GNAT superfamily N-acetyltransferase